MARPVVLCSFGAGPVPMGYSSYRSVTARKPQRPRPRRRFRCPGLGTELARKEGVHNVHTLGFGPGRTRAGLGRIGEEFGGVADFQGLEPGSSPTSGTVFPQVRGPFGAFFVWTAHTLLPLTLCSGSAGARIDPFARGGERQERGKEKEYKE